MRIHLNTFVYFVCFVVEMRFLGLSHHPRPTDRHNPVASGILGCIHRLVSKSDQFSRAGCVRRSLGHADAGGHFQDARRAWQFCCFKNLTDALCHGLRGLEAGFRANHQKLFPPQTA